MAARGAQPWGSVSTGSIDIQDDRDTRETEATVDLDNRSILQFVRNPMQDQDDELQELSALDVPCTLSRGEQH